MSRPKSNDTRDIVLTLRLHKDERDRLDYLAAAHAEGNTSGLMRRVLLHFLEANKAHLAHFSGAATANLGVDTQGPTAAALN